MLRQLNNMAYSNRDRGHCEEAESRRGNPVIKVKKMAYELDCFGFCLAMTAFLVIYHPL
jgi:hypothetical protein